ncbi:MAG: hypothetical protein ACOCTG_01215 [Bacteroidota bacterium]
MFIFALMTAACSAAVAQSAPDAPTGTIPPETVSGTWDFKLDIPGQPVEGELRLAMVGSALQGRITTADGQAYRFREVNLADSTFSFEVMTPEYGRINAGGKVNDNTFRGEVVLPDYGAFPWTGEKQKQNLSTRSQLRLLMADDAARAVIEKHMPGFLSQPGLEQAGAYSIRDIAAYVGGIPEDVLDAIDADLEQL